MQYNLSSSPPRFSRLINILKVFFAIFLIGFVFSNTRLDQLKTVFANISIGWAFLCFAFFVLSVLLKAFQYNILIDEKISYLQVVNLVVLQNAVSNFVATSAGIASYLTLFHVEYGAKIRRVAFVFLIIKMGDLIVIWLMLLISSWLVWPQVFAIHGVVILLLLVMGFAAVVMLVAVSFQKRFVEAVKNMIIRLGISHFNIVIKGMDFLQSFSDYGQTQVIREFKFALMTSSVYMVFSLVMAYANLRAFNLQLGISPIIFTNAIVQIISYLPVQIFGGLGVSEISNMFLYGMFNIPLAELSTVLIGVRILFYLMNLIVLLYLPVYSILAKQKRKIL